MKTGNIRNVIPVCLLLGGAAVCRGEGVVTNLTEADLRSAMLGGGQVRFECEGVLTLANTLVLTNDTVLDAAGRTVCLSGGGAVRLIEIRPGVALRLDHLVLADGVARGTNSDVGNGVGGTGLGGAVWNQGGILEATDCVLSNNAALGGTGGPGVSGTIGMNSGGPGWGGAIYNELGVLRLTNTVLTANVAQGGTGGSAPQPAPSRGGYGGPSVGGVVFSVTGEVTIAHCRFLSNSAPASIPGPANGYHPSSGNAIGGALYIVAGTTTLVDSQFERHFVGGGHWFCNAAAGALRHVAGTLTVQRCTFAGNKVRGGDGIIIGSGSNAGSADAGAVMLAYLATGEQGQTRLYCDARIADSCFVTNEVVGGEQGPAVGTAGYGRGGAIHNSAALQLINCTLAGNLAQGGAITYPSYPLSSAYGGALFNAIGTSILTHVTLALNGARTGAGAGGSSVAQGGAVHVSSGQVLVRNSLLATNAPGGNGSGTLTDGGGNLSSDATCAFAVPGSHNSIDAMLLPLGAYGGTTLTMPLRPGSPGIDAANAGVCLPADQSGVPRPQGAGCDIGAVEGGFLSLLVGGGVLQFSQGAMPNEEYTLESSTDFTLWHAEAFQVANPAGRLEFIIPSNSSGTFFRTLKGHRSP